MAGKPDEVLPSASDFMKKFAVAQAEEASKQARQHVHGIALGVVLSLLLLIYQTSHPHGGVLGQLPGTEAYRDVRPHPEARTFPGLLIWRVGADLFFASIGQMERALKNALAEIRPR